MSVKEKLMKILNKEKLSEILTRYRVNNTFKNIKIERKKLIKTVLACIIILLVLIVFFVSCAKNSKNKNTEESVSTTFVTRGNVESTISGSGALEPYERYEVIPLVNGEIISAPFNVGDYVEEGTVVYEFDTQDAELNLARQRNSMQKSTISYNESLDQRDNLVIKAPCNGVVQTLSIKKGDDVSAGKIITQIINTQDLEVKLPFNASQVAKMNESDRAVLTSSLSMSSISGTVTNIASTPVAEPDGASMYYVTIRFNNPGAVSEGDIFGGSVNGIASPGFGKVSFTSNEQVSSKIAGEVSAIYCKEGDYVKEGDVLVRLTSDSINNSLERSRIEYEDAKLSLQNQENTLDDYRVKAPISGTVLIKNSKAGDTIDRTNSSVTMMVIGDVSKLKFTLSIDELDVSKVKVGQKVNVTADAVENKTFIGEITNIAMEGTASNGVTTYEAEVTINNPQELKPSMNVDAVVVIESTKNVLRVPSSDITTSMGRSYVFVKDDGTADEIEKENENTVEPVIEDIPQRRERPDGMQMPPEAVTPERTQMPQRGGEVAQNREVRVPDAPAGFKAVEVKTGIKGDEFTQIISGLSEGQEIYQKQKISSSSGNMMFGRMSGGGMSGGMSGGMGAMGGMSGGPMGDRR